eukprot:SM000038S14364  [mRNA]  locus=s38:521150:525517:+ [translate_table: standard]
MATLRRGDATEAFLALSAARAAAAANASGDDGDGRRHNGQTATATTAGLVAAMCRHCLDSGQLEALVGLPWDDADEAVVRSCLADAARGDPASPAGNFLLCYCRCRYEDAYRVHAWLCGLEEEFVQHCDSEAAAAHVQTAAAYRGHIVKACLDLLPGVRREALLREDICDPGSSEGFTDDIAAAMEQDADAHAKAGLTHSPLFSVLEDQEEAGPSGAAKGNDFAWRDQDWTADMTSEEYVAASHEALASRGALVQPNGHSVQPCDVELSPIAGRRLHFDGGRTELSSFGLAQSGRAGARDSTPEAAAQGPSYSFHSPLRGDKASTQHDHMQSKSAGDVMRSVPRGSSPLEQGRLVVTRNDASRSLAASLSLAWPEDSPASSVPGEPTIDATQDGPRWPSEDDVLRPPQADLYTLARARKVPAGRRGALGSRNQLLNELELNTARVRW